MMNLIKQIFLCLGVLCVLSGGVVHADDIPDGFAPAYKVEGKHFTLYYKADVDVLRLLHNLDFSATDKILVDGKIVQTSEPEKEVLDALDNIFIQACEVLDMPLYSYKGNIKVFRTQEDLTNMFYRLYRRSLPDTGHSYYSFDLNTIYISEEYFKMRILAHEMAHAIVNHYFAVSPPEKIQEILAGYVEYQFRKKR
jgi:hypothetical protein